MQTKGAGRSPGRPRVERESDPVPEMTLKDRLRLYGRFRPGTRLVNFHGFPLYMPREEKEVGDGR